MGEIKAYAVPASQAFDIPPLIRQAGELERLMERRAKLIEDHLRALENLDVRIEKARAAARSIQRFRIK